LPRVNKHSSFDDEEKEFYTDDVSEEMKIAWRYQSKPTVSSNDSTSTSVHTFNLQKTINKNVLEKCDVNSWSPPTDGEIDADDFYRDAFAKLLSVAEKESFTLTPPSVAASPGPEISKNILRVSIQNLASLFWCDDVDGSKLTKFIFALRSLARHHLMICVVTMSQASQTLLATKNEASLSRIRSLCDVVIQLSPFNKQERKTGLYKDHHGVLVMNQIVN
jgi:hypothetical protein